MAKAAAGRKGGGVQRQGRRVMPALRRKARRAGSASQARAEPLTLGELIAAAFDTAGGEILEVLKVVTSPQLSKVLGRRIVLVG